MSDASDFISDLDAELARNGVTIALRRPGQVPNDVQCLASVRDYAAEEITGDVLQGQSEVIISPTQIIAAGWPGGDPVARDTRVPERGDQVWIAGQRRTIEDALPKYVGGALVRITLRVKGAS